MFLNSSFSRTRNKTTGNAFPLDSQEFSTFKKKNKVREIHSSGSLRGVKLDPSHSHALATRDRK